MQKWAVLAGLVFLAIPAFGEDAKPPEKAWASSIGAGVAITSGNTDTKNYNLSFATKYDPKTKFVFKADALYLRGESGGVTRSTRRPPMPATSTPSPTGRSRSPR